MSAKNIWVGNLPPHTNESKLVEIFAPYGAISSSKVIPTTKGLCGLVQYSDPNSAAIAISQINGTTLHGHALVCHLAHKDHDDKGPSNRVVGYNIPVGTNNSQLPHSSNLSPATYVSYATVTPNEATNSAFSCNVWIGNVVPTMEEEDLQRILSMYGTVTSLKLLRDRNTVTGSSACMVNFSNLSEATSAIEALNGYCLPGGNKPLIVRYANRRGAAGLSPSVTVSSTSPNLHGTMGTPSSGISSETNIWVGNLPTNFSEQKLMALFSEVGTVTSCKFLRDKMLQLCEGAGMVNFSHPMEASMAVQRLNGCAIAGHDKPLIVRLANASKHSSAPSTASASTLSRAPLTLHQPYSTTPTVVSATNIWVGNLPSYFTEHEVFALFSEFGNIVSARLLKDKQNRTSPESAAMINYSTPEEAATAIQNLHGQTIQGTEAALIVRYANIKPTITSNSPMHNNLKELTAGGGYGGVSVQSQNQPSPVSPVTTPSTNLWVGNIPLEYKEANLNTIFSNYGTVMQSVILKNKVTNESTGAGMVRFETPSQAITALTALNGIQLDPNSKPLEVRFATPKAKMFSSSPNYESNPTTSTLELVANHGISMPIQTTTFGTAASLQSFTHLANNPHHSFQPYQ